MCDIFKETEKTYFNEMTSYISEHSFDELWTKTSNNIDNRLNTCVQLKAALVPMTRKNKHDFSHVDSFRTSVLRVFHEK